MKILGETIFVLIFVANPCGAAALLFRFLPELSLSRPDNSTTRNLDDSIAYPFRRETTELVSCQPQEGARLFRGAGLMPDGALARHAYAGGPSEQLIPRACTNHQRNLVPPTVDATLVNCGQPVSGVRLRKHRLGNPPRRILARVQDHRPVTEHEVQIRWQRHSEQEGEELAAGSALDQALVNPAGKRPLLIQSWNSIDRLVIRGHNILQAMLYGQPGEKIPAPAVEI